MPLLARTHVVGTVAAVATVLGALAVAPSAAAPADVQPAPSQPIDVPTDVSAGTATPQASPAAEPTALPAFPPRRWLRLDRLLDRRLDDPRLGRTVGLIVLDAKTGAVISEHRPDRPLQAASNMKLITAATSLAAMGPDRRFPTRVLEGRRPGHVYLRGGGDPLLTREGLRALAARTARALERDGRVVVHPDTSMFAPRSLAPGWLDRYLGNSVGLVQSLALRGDRSRRPARNAAAVFVSALRQRGVDARLAGHGRAPEGARVLARIAGHSVADAVAVMLRVSESAVSEVLFRQVAIAVGRPATWAGAQRAAREVLDGMGIDTTGARLADGSGLSVDDRLSPRLVAEVLRVARVTDRQRFRAMFRPQAMPIAGRSGTLTTAYGRYSTDPSRCARGLVQAKTGTIYGTIALSGVADTRQGDRRIFSIIVNNRPGGYPPLSTRRAVDGLAATIAGCWD